MQLKITRNQYKTLILRRRRFRIDIRASYTGRQHELINKYGLWNQELYASEERMKHRLAERATGTETVLQFFHKLWRLMKFKFALHIKVKHLIQGRRIYCADIMELIDAENEVRGCADNLISYLTLAETFDGREIIHEIEEREIPRNE